MNIFNKIKNIFSSDSSVIESVTSQKKYNPTLYWENPKYYLQKTFEPVSKSFSIKVKSHGLSRAHNEDKLNLSIKLDFFNGITAYNLDFVEVTKFLNGKQPIFTCGCGSFGCSGSYSGLKYEGGNVNFQNIYTVHAEDVVKEQFSVNIEFKEWVSVLKDVLNYIHEIVNELKLDGAVVGMAGHDIYEKHRDLMRKLKKA